MAPAPVTTPRQVAVIGGGPAGMEAAQVAANRGHKVTLFEQSGQLGGQLIPASVPDSQVDPETVQGLYGPQDPGEPPTLRCVFTAR